MPEITVTYRRQDESVREAYDAARALLEEEKTRYPYLIFSADPSWVETSSQLVATLPGTINSEYVGSMEPIQEPVEEAEGEPVEETEDTSDTETSSSTGLTAALGTAITWLKDQGSTDDGDEEEAPVEEDPSDEESEPDAEVCQALKGAGEPCHRELPCQYHDE